jgi:hypothetical protein
MAGALAMLPLIVGALDELFVRQQRSPRLVGLGLGVVLVVEFFVSTELLVIVFVSAAVGLGVLAGYGLAVDRRAAFACARHALPGLVVAGAVSVVLLAYPLWYALAGPSHLSGRIWPLIPVLGGFTPASFVDAGSGSARSLFLEIGGYLGKPLPSASLMGVTLLGTLALGVAVFRRERRLWYFGAIAVVTGALTLGVRKHRWVPWNVIGRIPLLDNVVEQRFVAVTYLAVAVMLAVILDRIRRWNRDSRREGDRPVESRRRPAMGLVALAVAAAALAPVAVPLFRSLPYEIRPVDVPKWFADRAPKLPPGRTLLVSPPPFSGIQSAMAWQAIDGMQFAQAGGGGPQGTPERAGRERPGFLVLASLAFGFTVPPSGTAAQLSDVRRAIDEWGVDMVVVPREPGLPAEIRGHDPEYVSGFMTAALGESPVYETGSWVWNHVELRRAAIPLGPDTLFACTVRAERRPFTPGAVPACVVAGSLRNRR